MGQYITWPELVDFVLKLASLVFLILSCFYRHDHHDDQNRKR